MILGRGLRGDEVLMKIYSMEETKMICEGTLEDWASLAAGLEMEERAICLHECSADPRLQGDSVGDGQPCPLFRKTGRSIRIGARRIQQQYLCLSAADSHNLPTTCNHSRDSTTRSRSHSSVRLKSTALRIRRKNITTVPRRQR
jgi:hypothetical protein